jgi:hypothetical protein
VEKSSKRRVKGVAVFIVFLAVAMTLYKFQDAKSNTASMDFKPSANEYRDLKFINKAMIGFSADNTTKAKAGISQIMDKYSQQRIRKQNEGSFGAYLFTIPQDKLYTVVADLEALGTVGPQVEQIDTALVNLDSENEQAKLASYESELIELNKSRLPSTAQNERKEALHRLIQASRSNLDKLRNSSNVLLYLTLRPQRSTGGGWLSLTKNLMISFFEWLGILGIAAVLIYYGTKLLMLFLAAIGIRGPSGAVGGNYGSYGGYGGYSNYSRYSSKSGNSKRKIKRVYKDKASSTEQNNSDEKDNK